jgi:hypothetical protein
MGLPWKTFAQMQTAMQLWTASKVTAADLGIAINVAYRELVESHQWSARKAEAIVATVNEYSTGTVSLTQDSTAITGDSTVWTTAMTGRKIRIGGGDAVYGFTRVSGTSGTLSSAWPGANTSGESYAIFQTVYAVDATAGEVGTVLLASTDVGMEERSVAWVERQDPSRTAIGTPWVWIPHGLNASGAFLIEFWPRYGSATSVRIPYYVRVDDLSGSTQPIIRSDVVEALATSYAFQALFANTGDAHYDTLATRWWDIYQSRLEAALREDQDRHGLPREVQAVQSVSSGYPFVVDHDI